jgi:hypothetical protein
MVKWLFIETICNPLYNPALTKAISRSVKIRKGGQSMDPSHQDPNPTNAGQRRPSLIVFFVTLAVAVLLLMFFVFQGQRIAQGGFSREVLFIVWALVVLAPSYLLFGVLKSSGRFNYTSGNIKASFTGAAACYVFLLCVGYLVFFRVDQFDVTIRMHAADGSAPVISSGTFLLRAGNLSFSGQLLNNGGATVMGIPIGLKGQKGEVIPQVDGYKDIPQSITMTGNDAIDLALERVPLEVTGQLVPPPPDSKVMWVQIEGPQIEKTKVQVDQDGEFRFNVTAREGVPVKFTVFVNNIVKFTDNRNLSKQVILQDRKRN